LRIRFALCFRDRNEKGLSSVELLAREEARDFRYIPKAEARDWRYILQDEARDFGYIFREWAVHFR